MKSSCRPPVIRALETREAAGIDGASRFSRCAAAQNFSVNRLHALHLGNVILEVFFDAHLQRRVARRAADAGAEQANLHRAVGRHADKFEVAAVRLQRGANEVQHAADALANRWVGVLRS